MTDETARRPIKTRSKQWAVKLSSLLVRAGLTPNQVSVLSIFVSIAAGACFALTATADGRCGVLLFVGAAAGIQLRLLCNMLDGLIAVEGGQKTKSGVIYNELPDRIADIVILACAGYAVRDEPWGIALGWVAAVAAVMTAYVRAMSGALGAPQDFCGPMAKPHRMFVLTLGCLCAACGAGMGWKLHAVYVALIVIVAGSIITVVRRTLRLARALEAK